MSGTEYLIIFIITFTACTLSALAVSRLGSLLSLTSEALAEKGKVAPRPTGVFEHWMLEGEAKLLEGVEVLPPDKQKAEVIPNRFY